MERLDRQQQLDSDPSRKFLPEFSSLTGEQKLRSPAMDYDGDDDNNKIVVKSDDGFVALNIEELVAATHDQWDSIASPRTPVVLKSISRKGSQRSGGGGGGGGDAPSVVGGSSGRDKPPASGHVAIGRESAALPRPATPTAAGGARCRRAVAGPRPARWLDPRRVLFVFASLSCMGTLILLYFTLSMGGMTPTGDADSR